MQTNRVRLAVFERTSYVFYQVSNVSLHTDMYFKQYYKTHVNSKSIRQNKSFEDAGVSDV